MTQQRRGFEPTIKSFCLVGALDHLAKLTCLFKVLDVGLYECKDVHCTVLEVKGCC